MPKPIYNTKTSKNGKPKTSHNRLRDALRRASQVSHLKPWQVDSDPVEGDSGTVAALKTMFGLLAPVPKEWLREPGSRQKSGTKTEEPGELKTRRYSEIAREETAWLWDQRFAKGELNALHGDPEGGKTWVTLYMIACVTTGRPFCDGAPCQMGEALFVTAEDSPARTIGPRLDLLGADSTKVHHLDVVVVKNQERHLALDKNIPAIDKWLASHPDVSLVVIDPAAAFLGKVNANSNAEVREIQTQLLKVAGQHEVAFVLIDHLSKSHEKAKMGGIGSVAHTAGPRVVWQLRMDAEEPGRRLLLRNKINIATDPPDGLAFRLAKDQTPPMIWEKGPVKLTIDEVATSDGDTPRSEAKEWLLEQLAKGPVPSSQLQKQAKGDGLCWRTVKTAKSELGIESKKVGAGWCFVTKEQANQTKQLAAKLKKKTAKKKAAKRATA